MDPLHQRRNQHNTRARAHAPVTAKSVRTLSDTHTHTPLTHTHTEINSRAAKHDEASPTNAGTDGRLHGDQPPPLTRRQSRGRVSEGDQRGGRGERGWGG